MVMAKASRWVASWGGPKALVRMGERMWAEELATTLGSEEGVLRC